jgi:hypothetical protein
MNELDDLYRTDYQRFLHETEEAVKRAAAKAAPQTGDPMADYKARREAELAAGY